jgi:4-amino-4-deoxy-L-arabinose transferase-like glycosyltransferase
MRETHITIPELGLIAGTRGLLGFGLGLLLADRLPDDQRRAVGWALVAIGVLTSSPWPST